MTFSLPRLTFAGLALGAVILTAAALSGRQSAVAGTDAFDAGQKAAIEAIIKDYLIKNPEILNDMQVAYERKAEEARNVAFNKALTENGKELFNIKTIPVAGDPKGDVTVFEFFDYNCPHCRDAIDPLSKLIDTDKKVRVEFVDLSIIGGQTSEMTAKVVLAAARQGKYWELHKALMQRPGQVTRDIALKEAEKLGLDMGKLKVDMDGPEVAAILQSNDELRTKLKIEGTPHFIVGDQFLSGTPPDLYAELTNLIGGVRKNGCKVC